MKLEIRKRKNHDDVLLICESEDESRIIDRLGPETEFDDNGLAFSGKFEVRLSDGCRDHYILLKGVYVNNTQEMKMEEVEPKFTVLYYADNGFWLSRVREFFNDRSEAERLYDAKSKEGAVPTLRPHHDTDVPFWTPRP